MAIKRIILANRSRLLRQVFQKAIDKADNLEVVQEILDQEELPSAIEKLDPEWVILSLPFHNEMSGWIKRYMADHPSVRFILLSPENNRIKMKWQEFYEEDLTDLSLKDFIHILEMDFQHI